MPPHLLCDHARRTAAHEGVKDNAALGTTGEQTGFNQLRRVGGIVTAFARDGVDHPYIPFIAVGVDLAVGVFSTIFPAVLPKMYRNFDL